MYGEGDASSVMMVMMVMMVIMVRGGVIILIN